MPFDQESFDETARDIAAANQITFELASEYLALIGDTPELVSPESDLVIVRDGAREIARIKFPSDDVS
jgi:hypothetical protein